GGLLIDRLNLVARAGDRLVLDVPEENAGEADAGAQDEQRGGGGEELGLLLPQALTANALRQQRAGDLPFAHRLKRQPVGADQRKDVVLEGRRLLRVRRRTGAERVEALDLQLEVLLEIFLEAGEFERAAD